MPPAGYGVGSWEQAEPPAARYYGENRSGSSMYMYDKEQHHDQRQERGQDELR